METRNGKNIRNEKILSRTCRNPTIVKKKNKTIKGLRFLYIFNFCLFVLKKKKRKKESITMQTKKFPNWLSAREYLYSFNTPTLAYVYISIYAIFVSFLLLLLLLYVLLVIIIFFFFLVKKYLLLVLLQWHFQMLKGDYAKNGVIDLKIGNNAFY